MFGNIGFSSRVMAFNNYRNMSMRSHRLAMNNSHKQRRRYKNKDFSKEDVFDYLDEMIGSKETNIRAVINFIMHRFDVYGKEVKKLGNEWIERKLK